MLKETLIIEIKNIKKKLNKTTKPIGIQIPEGLKQYSKMIIDEFKDHSPLLFIDPCYGACDLKDNYAKKLGCKLLIHFGHYKMTKPKIKTLFVPISYSLDNNQINYIIREIKKLNINKINLVTTIQYLKNIKEIKKILKQHNITVLDCNKTKRVKEHMVLGCDCSTIKKNKYPIVFIGDGNFHVNNIAFMYETQKIYTISPLSNKTIEVNISDKFLRQRYSVIAKARNCENFAILVSTKVGQERLKLAKDIKNKLEKNNKKAYIFVSDYINENYMIGTKIDCYINTACPRISYDDQISYTKPILSASEIDLLFDINKKIKIDQIN